MPQKKFVPKSPYGAKATLARRLLALPFIGAEVGKIKAEA
jgi:hypothetical protein